MTNEPENYTAIALQAPLRRRWVTPRIFVGECGDSEGGNGVYPTDGSTTEGFTFTGS